MSGENVKQLFAPADAAVVDNGAEMAGYVKDDAIEPEVLTPDEFAELGATAADDGGYLTRQLSPLVQQAAEKIKEGFVKSKKDTLIGMALGAVIVLSAHYIMREKD